MSDKKLRRLVLSALLAALTCVATVLIQIPSPMQGYVNLGDCFVLLSGWLLGPWYGAAAGGLGSFLADMLTGYAFYAPGTLAVKGAMALVAGLTLRASSGRGAGYLLGGAVAEGVMILGYFGYAALVLGNGLAAAASIPGNAVQGAVGLAAGAALLTALRRAGVEKRPDEAEK